MAAQERREFDGRKELLNDSSNLRRNCLQISDVFEF